MLCLLMDSALVESGFIQSPQFSQTCRLKSVSAYRPDCDYNKHPQFDPIITPINHEIDYIHIDG